MKLTLAHFTSEKGHYLSAQKDRKNFAALQFQILPGDVGERLPCCPAVRGSRSIMLGESDLEKVLCRGTWVFAWRGSCDLENVRKVGSEIQLSNFGS